MNENLKGYIILESAPEIIEKPKILTSRIDNSKDEVVIETVLQEAEVPNRNKHYYKKSALESGLSNSMFQEKLKRKNLFGEANHPLSDSVQVQTRIDQTRMSHIIEDVYWEGNILKGIVAAANTACGKDFAGLVRQGCEMAFSMRGLGGVVKKKGELTEIYQPLLIVTYDWVTGPSHPNAYQTSVIKESFNVNSTENKILNEGCLIPTEFKKDISKYIMNESTNVKTTLDELELEAKNPTLNENSLMMEVETKEGKMSLFLEDNIKNEINSFLKSL